MKNKLLLFVMFAVMVMASCTKMEQAPLLQPIDNEGEFTAIFENSETKTSLGNGGAVLWSADDMVSIITRTSHNRKYKLTEGEGTTSGTFGYQNIYSGVDFTAPDQNYAFYPYSESIVYANANHTFSGVEIPATQNYAANSFENGAAVMVAKSATKDLGFTNAMSMLKVGLNKMHLPDDVAVKSIKVMSQEGPKIAGSATIDMSVETPSVVITEATGTRQIELQMSDPVSLSESEFTYFYVTIPPTTFPAGKLVIRVTLADDTFCDYGGLGEVAFNRNMIVTFERTINAEEFRGTTPSYAAEVSSPAEVAAAINVEQPNPAVKVTSPVVEDVVIELPSELSAEANPSVSISLTEVTEGNTVTFSNANYSGQVNIECPSSTGAGIEINLPNATVFLNGVQVDNVTATTTDMTCVIGKETTISNTLTVAKGNVKIYGSVANIARTGDNPDAITKVFLYGDAVKPATEDPKISFIRMVSNEEELVNAIAGNYGDIMLAQNMTIGTKLDITYALCLDLNGKTLTSTESTSRTYSIDVYGQDAIVIIKNGKFVNTSGRGFRSYNGADLTIDSDCYVEVNDYAATVGLTGTNPDGALPGKLTVKGDISSVNYGVTSTCGTGGPGSNTINIENAVIVAGYSAFSQNGNTGGHVITITNSDLKSIGSGSAVYVSNKAASEKQTLSISGCTLLSTEASALEVKHTNATISNTTLISQATSQSYDSNSNGECTVGYCIASTINSGDVCSSGTITVTNTIMNFKASGGKAIYNHLGGAHISVDGVPQIDNYVGNSDDLLTLIQGNQENIHAILTADISVVVHNILTLGGENTRNIILEGMTGNETLTLSSGYMTELQMTNPDGKVTMKNLNLTNTLNQGPWNVYDVIFGCEVELNNVDVARPIAIGRDAILKNVTVTELGNWYAVWITGLGQEVCFENCSIICNQGRGIKISQEYMSEEHRRQVTLNIKGTSFDTKYKAAVLVGSNPGAIINWQEGNDISNVTADSVNAVWTDTDWKDYDENVIVSGCTKIIEP